MHNKTCSPQIAQALTASKAFIQDLATMCAFCRSVTGGASAHLCNVAPLVRASGSAESGRRARTAPLP
eukprot:1158904-Amphidinium_carterae.1